MSARQDLAAGAVVVFAPGRPRTKGSLKPAHIRTGAGRCKVGLREDGEYSVAWKKSMIAAIREQALCARWPHAVRVDVVAVFEREGPEPGLEQWPTGHGYGDFDKLERNVLDALTQSGLIFDDALVLGPCRPTVAGKRFAEPGEPAGVWIRVEPVNEDAP